MNRLLTTLITIVLLMAAQMANAQNSGSVEQLGFKLNYSFSGGTIIEQGDSFEGIQRGYTCEVTPGTTVTFHCELSHPDDRPRQMYSSVYASTSQSALDGKTLYSKSDKGKSISYSYTVPKEAGYVKFSADCSTIGSHPGAIAINIGFKVVDNTTPKTEPKAEPKKQGYDYVEDPDCECMKRLNNQKTDSHIRFNDLYGEVKIKPNCDVTGPYEFAEIETVIYECDRIKTEEESGAILGLEDMSTYVIKPESILVIWTEEKNVSKLEMLIGSMWENAKRMSQNKSLEIELSQCCLGIGGTIYAVEETGKESKVWLFAGKVTVTNNKTKKVTVLQPGQNITCKGSSSNVQSFDIEQGAKKFGIPMDHITNHYTNKPISKVSLENICKPNKGTDSKNTTTGKKPTTKKTSTKLSSDQTIEEGVYVIRFAHDPEYVLTLKDGKVKNDNTVQLWKWRNDNSQKWRVTHENGKIAIRSMVDNNYALDVKNFNYSNNAEIILYGFHGGDNQLWIPEKQSNGSYVLMTAGNTAFCLDLYEGDAKNGGVVELWSTHKGFQEQWTFEKVETTGKLKTTNNQKSGNKQVKHGKQNNSKQNNKGKQNKPLKIKR